jgi:1-acyl-sn-glycerol-3-phosphate acyltransferase
VSLHYSAARFFIAAGLRVLTGWRVAGRGNIPATGGIIVASNHVSFWDPPLVGAAQRRELHYLAKEELFRVPLLGAAIRAVNAIPIRRGVADLSGMARAIEALRQGHALLMFPEGSRMRDGRLHPARPGVGMLAVNADVAIVPCHVSGSRHPRRWWTRAERVRISFGAPRTWKELAGPDVEPVPGRALYQAVGDGVMREIAALREEQLNQASRGTARSRAAIP